MKNLPTLKLKVKTFTSHDSKKILPGILVKSQAIYIGDCCPDRNTMLKNAERGLKIARQNRLLGGGNTNTIYFPESDQFNDSRKIMYSVIDFIFTYLENVLPDNFVQGLHNLSISEEWFIRGILQLHYCIGSIEEPSPVLLELYCQEIIKEWINTVTIDAYHLNILRADFKGIKEYFKIKGWEADFSSPIDFHLDLMKDGIVRQLQEPFRKESQNHISVKKQNKAMTLFRDFMNNKLSQQEDQEICEYIENIGFLFYKFYIAIKYRRRHNSSMNHLIKFILDNTKDNHPITEEILWIEGRGYLYSSDKKKTPLNFD